MPEAVKYVYCVSYDSKNDTCALYYADNDSEDIGILKEGQTKIASVFTFSQNHYAYQDKIDCHDGHIYWIAQANVSGNITDHYTFIDYNYLDHKPTEIAEHSVSIAMKASCICSDLIKVEITLILICVNLNT